MAEQADQLELRINGGPQSYSQHLSLATKSNIIWQHIEKEVTSFDRPAMLYCGSGSPQLSWACS